MNCFPTNLLRDYALITALLMAGAAAAAAPWHHSPSPYRFRMTIASEPNHARAGLAVAVPTCGLAPADGADLFAYDGHGRRLQLLSLGHGIENRALAVVEHVPGADHVWLYFGSQIRSPQNRAAFERPLTVSLHPLTTHRITGWQQVSQLLRTSAPTATLFMDQIALRHNPVNSHRVFLVDFQGSLNIPEDGDYTFMLVSDDVGFLMIGGKLVIDRAAGDLGAARHGEFRETVSLRKGTHPIRCTVAQIGGNPAAVVGQWMDERNKFILKPEQFVQPGRTDIERFEVREPNAACPVFWQRHVSYIGYDDRQYTEVELGTYNGQPARWSFSDGGMGEGAEVRRIFFELDTRQVRVRQGGKHAEGDIAFPQNPPSVRQIGNRSHFENYAAIMLEQRLDRLDLSTLEGYRNFLRYREFNPQTAAVCKAILGKDDLPVEYRREILVELARISVGAEPDTARSAFAALLRSMEAGTPRHTELMLEYAAAALLEMGDPETADSLVRAVHNANPRDNLKFRHVQIDMALLADEPDAAAALMDRVRSSVNMGSRHQRFAAVKANALRERFDDLLASGFLHDANTVLWEWISLAPQDRVNGSWPLARARLWRAMHRQRGALALLDSAILLNPLLPNLPEVQLERTRVLKELGEEREATAAARHIVEQFPNHPAAREAERLMQ